ncbi:MAG: flagellar export protein FliJ [Desulfocucumaceae bacterium]
MKKFSYRLEPLLKYRSEIEEKAVMEQSVAQKQYLDQLGILEDVRNNLKETLEAEIIRVTADECLARSLFIDYLTESESRQVEIVDRSMDELEKKRAVAVEARRDRLVLQKLKEKLYQKHIEEFNRWDKSHRRPVLGTGPRKRQELGIGNWG